MKSFRLCFYLVLLTWKIVHSEVYAIDDETSDLGFPKEREETDFVDPFSLDYDKSNKRMVDKESRFQRSVGVCGSEAGCRKDLKQCQDQLENIEFDKLFSSRLINLLLSTAKLKETGDDLFSGSLTLSGTKAQIEGLRKFGSGGITTREVDSILSDMIIPTTNTFADTFTFFESLPLIFDTYRGIFIAALTAVGTLIFINYTNWTTGKVIIVFLGIGMLMTYFMTWSRLMKEAELKHMARAMQYKEPPIQCNPEKMWFWDKIITIYQGHDDCYEYHKSMNFNVFEEVTLNDVTSEVLGKILIGTIAQVGSSYSFFIENATKNLPFYLRWIMTILLYLILPGAIYCMCGGHIRLWMGFSGVSIGGGESNQNRQLGDRMARIERILDSELPRQVTHTPAHSTDDNRLALGDGDTKPQTEKAKPGNSDSACSSCCCKKSLSKSHVQDEDNLVNKSTESKEEIKEKGAGDS